MEMSARARSQRLYLWALAALTVMVGIYDVVTCWYDIEGSSVYAASGFFFVVLLVLWVDADSRQQPGIYRPFEYGWLAFFYWIPYLPYYFWRTRGAKGVLLFSGIALVFFLGWMVQWQTVVR